MAKILLPNGLVINRKPTARALGNFCQMYVRYKNNRYAIGNGDEYLRGEPESYKLEYLSDGSGNPRHIIYPDDRERIAVGQGVYKNYIELPE